MKVVFIHVKGSDVPDNGTDLDSQIRSEGLLDIGLPSVIVLVTKYDVVGSHRNNGIKLAISDEILHRIGAHEV
jgi:hypothetical protein